MKKEQVVAAVAKELVKKVDVDALIYNISDAVSHLGTNYSKQYWFGPWCINIMVRSQRD